MHHNSTRAAEVEPILSLAGGVGIKVDPEDQPKVKYITMN